MRDGGGVQMSTRDTAVLCYVDRPWLWFTTAPLSEQWGDDWNDAPYEHNAGSPYWWLPGRGKPFHELFCMAVRTTMETPAERSHFNSPWSVEQINRGEAPWLQTRGFDPPEPPIMAGTTYAEVKGRLLRRGDRVLEEVER